MHSSPEVWHYSIVQCDFFDGVKLLHSIDNANLLMHKAKLRCRDIEMIVDQTRISRSDDDDVSMQSAADRCGHWTWHFRNMYRNTAIVMRGFPANNAENDGRADWSALRLVWLRLR